MREYLQYAADQNQAELHVCSGGIAAGVIKNQVSIWIIFRIF